MYRKKKVGRLFLTRKFSSARESHFWALVWLFPPRNFLLQESVKFSDIDDLFVEELISIETLSGRPSHICHTIMPWKPILKGERNRVQMAQKWVHAHIYLIWECPGNGSKSSNRSPKNRTEIPPGEEREKKQKEKENRFFALTQIYASP